MRQGQGSSRLPGARALSGRRHRRRILAAQDQRDRESAERHATDAAQTYRATPQSPTIDMPDLETVDERPPIPPPPRQVYVPPAYLAKELTLDLPPEDPPSRAWWFGVALLLMVLAAQLAFAFRGPAAQRYPALRPPRGACVWLKCTVPMRAKTGCSSSRVGALEVPASHRDRLAARIRNLASSGAGVSAPRAHPHRQQRAGRGATRAAAHDYSGAAGGGEVIAPGVELALQLRSRPPRLKGDGYELLLFTNLSSAISRPSRPTSGASFTCAAMPRRICSAATPRDRNAVAPVNGLVKR